MSIFREQKINSWKQSVKQKVQIENQNATKNVEICTKFAFQHQQQSANSVHVVHMKMMSGRKKGDERRAKESRLSAKCESSSGVIMSVWWIKRRSRLNKHARRYAFGVWLALMHCAHMLTWIFTHHAIAGAVVVLYHFKAKSKSMPASMTHHFTPPPPSPSLPFPRAQNNDTQMEPKRHIYLNKCWARTLQYNYVFEEWITSLAMLQTPFKYT